LSNYQHQLPEFTLTIPVPSPRILSIELQNDVEDYNLELCAFAQIKKSQVQVTMRLGKKTLH